MQNFNLYCPFPSRINPNVRQTNLRTADWLDQFSLIGSEEEFYNNQQGKFTYMVARMFPNATVDALTIASDLNALLFLIDDHFDGADTGMAKKQQFEGFVQLLIAIVEDKRLQNIEQKPTLAAFADIWRRLRANTSAAWKQRFAESLKNALVANLWRMETLDKHQMPTLADYIYYRPMIGGANFFAYLVEVMEDVFLPEEAFASEHIQRMITLCSETICFANDVFSYKKELAVGDQMNLVMLLCNEKDIDIRTAVKQACEIHNTAVDEFIYLSANLPMFSSPQVLWQVRKYITALGVMMRGNIDWSQMDTSRYKQPVMEMEYAIK